MIFLKQIVITTIAKTLELHYTMFIQLACYCYDFLKAIYFGSYELYTKIQINFEDQIVYITFYKYTF